MRYLLVIIFIFNSAVSTYSQDINTIVDKKFTYGFMIGGVSLKINSDSTYEAECGSEGISWYNTGRYIIRNNSIILEPLISKPYKDSKDTVSVKDTLGKAELTIIDKMDSLYSTKYLQCKSFSNNNLIGTNSSVLLFIIDGFKVKEDDERIFNGIKVIIVDKNGLTNNNAKIRKRPSVKSDSIEYSTSIYLDPNNKTYDYVPKGTKMTVIARTATKQQVDKWNNYWYLISVGFNSEVWMFGEFIDIIK
jgi:hypothetical protein